jgi:glycosyltransferase involved in cell wall biosynthesis
LFFTPHFVDNDFFSERAVAARGRHEPDAIRRSLGLSPTSTVFAFAGKLIEKKRPLDFVRALGLARAEGHDIQGLIIGSGPLDAEVRALVESLDVPVGFAGFRNQSELPAYFSAADALVLPSDAGETWGLVVNEAMACGLPACVSTSAGCSRDLIDEGRTGYVFPVGEVAQFAEAMGRLTVTLSNERADVERAVRQRIAQYSCNAAVDGTLAALERIQ